jgi:hypothetical protein
MNAASLLHEGLQAYGFAAGVSKCTMYAHSVAGRLLSPLRLCTDMFAKEMMLNHV